MVDRARYEALGPGLPGTEPRRYFRHAGFGVNGRQFVHLDTDAPFLAMTAEDAAAFVAGRSSDQPTVEKNV